MITALIIFIITVYLRTAGFFELMADRMLSFSKTPLQLLILAVSIVVMLLKPLVHKLGSGQPLCLWLALAMSSTLAGNLTLIGSVANLIVAQQARKRVEIGFLEYFRVGAFITVITIELGILVLGVEVKLASGTEAFAMERSGKQMTATIVPLDAHAASRTFNIVLLCDTNETKTRGLQGFRRLKDNEAALFLFEPPQVVTFWMGTVAYLIDIVFIGPDNKIVRVYPNCMPGSRDLYPSGERVARAIETAADSGIRVGDKVRIESAGPRGPGRKP